MEKIKGVSMNQKKTGDRIIPPHPPLAKGGRGDFQVKVVCIVGPAKSGKTLLIERLTPELNRRGLRVATIKHTHHHNVSLDIPGKDTYRYRQAGAEIIVLASPDGFSILTEEKGVFGLEEVVSALPEKLDIILVEGFKQEGFPKIEVVPDDTDPLFINNPSLLAIVSSNTFPAAKIPCFKPTAIADMVELLTAEPQKNTKSEVTSQ